MPNQASRPRHIAIIMDGNGRWATARGLSRVQGHRAGVRAIDAIVRYASEIGIEVLTLFAFSSENWSRPKEEISALMGLFQEFFQTKLSELMQENVRIRLIGERRTMPIPQRLLAEKAEEMSKRNTGLLLQIAFNYGARQEIVSATRMLAEDAAKGIIRTEDINEELLQSRLFAPQDVDLLIRTSGEVRLSNFLLYQCAYAELMFADEYWPDYTPESLAREIAAFQNRKRRFGGLDEGETV